MQEKYNVTGMTCAACQARVQKSVSDLTGVQECNVNLLKNSMVVTAPSTQLWLQCCDPAEKACLPGSTPRPAPAHIRCCAQSPDHSQKAALNLRKIQRALLRMLAYLLEILAPKKNWALVQ